MSSFPFALVLAVFGAISVSADVFSNHPMVKSHPNPIQYLRHIRGLRQKVIDNGCEVNLCFGIDGSGSTTPAQFQKQKDFADLIVNILTTDESGNYCAVQYSTSNKAISPLTGKKNQFIKKLHRAKQRGGLTNVAAAIGYLGFQLLPRKEDANKIILMGDGFNSIGFAPKRVAAQVLKRDIDICAVAVGPSDVKGLAKVTGDKNRVLRLANFFELAEIVSDIVYDTCGY